MAIVGALLAAPGSAAAATRTWIGGDGLWNDATKWMGGIPQPGDIAYTNNDSNADITLSGTGASVAAIYGTAHLVVNGTGLTVTGDPVQPSNLSMSEISGGGALAVTGSSELTFTSVTLGETTGTPTSGTVTISAAATLSGSLAEAGPGLGTFTITPAGSVGVLAPDDLSIEARVQNRGTLHTSAVTDVVPSAGSPASDGDFTVDGTGTLRLRPPSGSTFTLAGDVTGDGSIDVAPFATGNAGEVGVPAGGTFTPGVLAIGGAGRLDLNRDVLVGRVDMVENTGSGGRYGDGLLTVGPNTSLLEDAQLGGTGVTVFNGQLLIEASSGSTRLRDSALVRTNVSSSLKEGGLDLGAATVWENAGTLTISNIAPAVTSLSGPGVLRNLVPGTISKQTSAQFLGSGSTENAGTIDIGGGSFGADAPAGVFGTLTQTAGQTMIASGATLDKSVVLAGGTLRGSGTVRSIANNAGIVEPGASPGTLSVAGNYSQGAAGTLRAEIAGTVPGSGFDVLSVGGVASLGGTLVIASGGFEPPAGSAFRILTAGSRSGEWATVTGAEAGARTYRTSYQPDGATLTADGPPPDPPAAFDAATRVSLSLAAKTMKAGAPLKVVVTNRNPFRVQGTLSGSKLDRKRFSATPARRATVRLKLSKKLRARLKQKGTLSVRLTAKVSDPAGNTRTVRKVVKPKLARKRK